MQDIITLISNVGFPIACCVFLFKQQNKLTDTLTELSSTMSGIKTELSNINMRLDNLEDKN